MATYSDVSWARREAVSSAKLQQMADNEAYLKAMVDAAPRGVLGRSSIKTIQSSNSIWWDVPGLSTSVSYEAGRVIKASCSYQALLPWGAPGIWAVQIQSLNTETNGAYKVIAEAWVDLTTDHLACGGGSFFAIGTSSRSGSGTWKVSVKSITGSNNGTIFFYASSDGPAYLTVEDIGKSR